MFCFLPLKFITVFHYFYSINNHMGLYWLTEQCLEDWVLNHTHSSFRHTVTCKVHNLFGGKYCEQESHTHAALITLSFPLHRGQHRGQDNKRERQTTLILLTQGRWLWKKWMRDSYQCLSTISCLSSKYELRSVCPLQILNRRTQDCSGISTQGRWLIVVCVNRETTLRSVNELKLHIPWALWCETAKRRETMITFIKFIRHFPLLLSHAFSLPFHKISPAPSPKRGPLKRQSCHLTSVWAAKRPSL